MKFKSLFPFLFFFIHITSYADVDGQGYYSLWEQLKNLKYPPLADSPVEPESRTGPYPLLTNPENFDDGFEPDKYDRWQQIELHESTQAKCGNGTNFRFYFKRSHKNKNLLIMFEPGGACWDYESCSGQGDVRGAANPDGIKDNHVHQIGVKISSPFMYHNLLNKFEARDWSLVYIPYCTGDVHVGDVTKIYYDPKEEAEPLTWHHNGMKNTRAVMAWLKNNLPRPYKMLTTGCSAGGTGSLVQYYLNRTALQPNKSYLFNDSGPVFSAPVDQGVSEFPSIYLHEKIRKAWNLDPYIEFLQNEMGGVDPQDFGSITTAVAKKFPHDRFLHAHFQMDLTYSSYSYERFHENIIEQQNQTLKKQSIRQLWQQDTLSFMRTLKRSPNWGYFFPYFRNLNESHCTSIVEFKGSDIQEQNIEFLDVINGLLNNKKPLTRAFEQSPEADLKRPVSWFWKVVNDLIGVETEELPNS